MKGFPVVLEQKVTWRDLDALGHVNNAVYATYFENGRLAYVDRVLGTAAPGRIDGADRMPGGSDGMILAELTITYRSPAFLRETLLIGARVSEVRTSSFVVESQIEEKETGRLVATSRAVMVHYDYTENRATPVPPEWREAMALVEMNAR